MPEQTGHAPEDVAAVIRAIFGVTDYESASDGAEQQANRVLDALTARGWRAPGPRVTAAEREAIECGLVYIDRGRGRSSMPDPDGVAYVDRCVATLRAMLDGGGA